MALRIDSAENVQVLSHIVHLTSSHNQSLTLESIRNKISHPVIRGIVSLVICMAFYNTTTILPPLPWTFSWGKNQNSNQKHDRHTSESLSLHLILSNVPGLPFLQLNHGLGDIYYGQANILLSNPNSKIRKCIANNWSIWSFFYRCNYFQKYNTSGSVSENKIVICLYLALSSENQEK